MKTSKKKIIIISSIIAVILIAVVIAILLLNITKLKVVDNFTIEYGNEISNNVADYVLDNTDEKVVKNTTVEIVGLDESSEYPSVGEYVVKVKYKNQVKEVIVTVEDTTKPVFKDFNKDINIYTGEQVDWNTLFVADDLSDVTISVDDSNIDYSKAGTYQIEVVATDSSNNSVSETANLNIIQTSLTLNTTSVSIKKGNTYQLQSTVVGRDQNVKYSSSDTSVVTVDDTGKIVGVGKGTATITVESNGLSVTCEVTVTVATKTTSNGNKNTGSQQQNSNNSSSNNSDDSSNAPEPDGWDVSTDSSELGDPDDNRIVEDDDNIFG